MNQARARRHAKHNSSYNARLSPSALHRTCFHVTHGATRLDLFAKNSGHTSTTAMALSSTWPIDAASSGGCSIPDTKAGGAGVVSRIETAWQARRKVRLELAVPITGRQGSSDAHRSSSPCLRPASRNPSRGQPTIGEPAHRPRMIPGEGTLRSGGSQATSGLVGLGCLDISRHLKTQPGTDLLPRPASEPES
jgi:hypothetical protein